MSVDIISLALYSGKTYLRRYYEKFRYILSLLRYPRGKQTRVGIPKNFSRQYVFSLSTVVCNKKMCGLKIF